MTHKRDIADIVRRRIDKLKEEQASEALRDDLSPLETDEGKDQGVEPKPSKKAKLKRLNGYSNKQGRKSG